MSTSEKRAAHLHRWVRAGASGAVALAVVTVALSLPASESHRTETLRQANEQLKADRGEPHVDPPGSPLHVHDAAFKNAISRGGETTDEASDPTTAAQAREAADYVASERTAPDPQLTPAPKAPARKRFPQDRYAMAGGCYTIATDKGVYARTVAGGVKVARMSRKNASRFTFKATRLTHYLLYGAGGVYLAGSDGVAVDQKPSGAADWIVVKRRTGGFAFRLRNGSKLLVRDGRMALGAEPTLFTLQKATGCEKFPESQISIDGQPYAGVTPYQEVRGFVDAHTHGMAFEFLGGDVHCGRPWHKWGVAYALRDCVDHTKTDGKGAVLEAFLSGEPSHDPIGWPTFRDWPAPHSLTHEGTYYRWMERAWRGGQRLFVNLLVENNKLCEIYPLNRNSCDDMDSVRLQAKGMYRMQDYIDAQAGGPGKGFYRIVKSPSEAREVINAGKLAVIMGIETSVPFGCTFKAVGGQDIPACTAEDITTQIEEMHRMGVRQMELVNKFDNALAGVAGDAGSTGVIVNGANFLETGTFWDMKHCEPEDGESADNPQYAFPDSESPPQDAIFGAIGAIFGQGNPLPAVPLYPPPAHCNSRGLTDLGTHTIEELAKRHMIFDPDHLSVKARAASMDVIEDLEYPGVISSHSWSTPDTYPRIYRAGGFIAPYAGDSTGFVDKWRRHVGWADPRYYWGLGFGADINGLGAQGDPRGADVANPVTYPFKGLGGVTVKQQHAGKRVYDINTDGVAQYGLYPDWVEDLTKVAGGDDGDAIFDDMSRGAEAYLQMWERAEGIAADSCRNPELRKSVSEVKRLVKRGMTPDEVMSAVGQPFRRLSNQFGICATAPGKDRANVRIVFSPAGKVSRVRR